MITLSKEARKTLERKSMKVPTYEQIKRHNENVVAEWEARDRTERAINQWWNMCESLGYNVEVLKRFKIMKNGEIKYV